ncbi:flagellar hook-associated family protein [Methylocystis sp. IM3]|uniref:flagellar hook-associated family protein n=1 Tax=unclassified Methylocystis TaxID=2625913 RepID=UPI0030F92C1E
MPKDVSIADLGTALGVRASQCFSVAGLRDTIDATLASNQVVATRLDTTQVALSALRADAQNMRATLMSAQTDGGEPTAIIKQADQALATLMAKLNSSNADGFLFGGISIMQEPIADYFAKPSQPNKLALDAAYETAFGFTQSNSAVSSISPTQMQGFLTGAFAQLFSDAGWKSDWSSASDSVLRAQVSLSVTMDASVSANEPALPKIASAYAMLTDLGAERLNRDSYAVLLKAAMDTLDIGVGMLTNIQARVGVMQNSVKNASDVMSIQKDGLDTQLSELESIDPTEAGARVNELMTRIETAYTLTARISQLSLTKYL